MTTSGSIVSGRGLVGELSRFNFWMEYLYDSQIRDMTKKCGGEVGNLIAWPEVKYYIVGDVAHIPRTTCIKPG